MAKSKEFTVLSKDETRWRVIETIYERWMFLEQSSEIVLEPLVHLKDVYPDDVRIIVNRLAYNEKVIDIINPASAAAYTIDKDKIKAIIERSHQIIRIKILDNFSIFFEEEQRKHKISSKQKLSLQITALKKEIESYQKIFYGIAHAKYDFRYKKPNKRDGVAKDIHGALTKAGIGDKLTSQIIARKLHDTANKISEYNLPEEYD